MMVDTPASYDFEVSGGEIKANGKTHWPHMLTLVLTHKQALHLIEDLARRIEFETNRSNRYVLVNLLGKLTSSKEDTP